MALKGNNLLIFLNGTAIAGATVSDAQSGVDLLEIGSPIGSGQWKQFITRRKYWSVNVNYLVLQNTGVRSNSTAKNSRRPTSIWNALNHFTTAGNGAKESIGP